MTVQVENVSRVGSVEYSACIYVNLRFWVLKLKSKAYLNSYVFIFGEKGLYWHLLLGIKCTDCYVDVYCYPFKYYFSCTLIGYSVSGL